MKKQVLEFLNKNKEEKYKKFSSSLLPKAICMLGVRMPLLKEFAKELLKGDWKKYLEVECDYFEEKMIQGLLIALSDIELSEKWAYIEKFVEKIDNWSINDSLCCTLKFKKAQKGAVFELLKPYINNESEYKCRFYYVMLLTHFVEEKYLGEIFKHLNEFKNKQYYARMAAAWLISVCCVKFLKQTEEFLKTTKLDKITFNMAIQKISDSKRICAEDKIRLKKLKKS